MKTKDFIKILQEADPSGEGYVRLPCGGAIRFVEAKEGYWDGPYSYIDEDGKYVSSTQGYKIDVYTKEPTDFIWEDLEWNSYQENVDGLFDKLKENFVFKYGYHPDSTKERIDSFFKGMKEDLDRYIEYKKESDKKYLEEVISKFKKGWKFFQKKNFKMKFYDWDIINEKGQKEGANWATTGPILLSGKFKSIDQGEYLEWVLE